MAFYEKPFYRDGVRMPIQCITVGLDASANAPSLHYHEYTELLFGLTGSAQVYIGAKHYTLQAGGMERIAEYGTVYLTICCACSFGI